MLAQAILLQAREPGFYMPDLPIYSITIALFVVTVLAFVWASSSGGKKKKKKKRAARGPVEETISDSYMGDIDLPGGGGARRSEPEAAAPAPAEATSRAAAGSILPWMTFAVSLFGTVSSFILSLLTYLGSQS